MNGIAVYDVGSAYLCGGLVAAAALSVFADTYRSARFPDRGRQDIVILLAAALWPVVVLGVAQLGVLMVFARVTGGGRARRPSYQC